MHIGLKQKKVHKHTIRHKILKSMGCASTKGNNRRDPTRSVGQTWVRNLKINTIDLRKEAILGSWQMLNLQVANVGCIAFMRYVNIHVHSLRNYRETWFWLLRNERKKIKRKLYIFSVCLFVFCFFSQNIGLRF